MTIFGWVIQIGKQVDALFQSTPKSNAQIITLLGQIIQQQAVQTQQLAEIIETLTTLVPTPAVGFTIDLTQQGDVINMAKSRATVDFQLFDNGQAVATLTVVDKAGLATVLPTGASVPAWTSSDPGVVVSAASDGMSAIVSPATPPVLVTGAVISATSTESDGTTKLTGSAEPIDVIGSAAAGFSVALSNPAPPPPPAV